jgi:hypothetical protein
LVSKFKQRPLGKKSSAWISYLSKENTHEPFSVFNLNKPVMTLSDGAIPNDVFESKGTLIAQARIEMGFGFSLDLKCCQISVVV